MMTSAAKQKHHSLEGTVTKSQQVIIPLKICVVLCYFSNISCFIRLQTWGQKSAVWEIAVPAAFAKYFGIHVSIEKGGLLSQNSHGLQGGETCFSCKRHRQEKCAWC